MWQGLPNSGGAVKLHDQLVRDVAGRGGAPTGTARSGEAAEREEVIGIRAEEVPSPPDGGVPLRLRLPMEARSS